MAVARDQSCFAISAARQFACLLIDNACARLTYLSKFVERYGGRKPAADLFCSHDALLLVILCFRLERARDLFEQAVEKAASA